MLLGNDVNSKLQVNINVNDRYCTYFHPQLGTQKIQFSRNKESGKLNFNVVMLDTPIESEEMD